ncbi:MAG: penicillin acylase family protein [Pseudomonadota bacterium]
MTAVKALALGALVSGCALLVELPEPITRDARLSQFPTEDLNLIAPVTLRWDDHKVPFIEASTDRDAAYALGLVHAHLRLGQMALLRRLVQGRLSESAGPFTTEIDTALRAFDFDRATPAVYAAMPDETKVWLEAYVEGVNAYAAQLSADQLPHEFELLGIDWEPWTAADSITIGRASGLDINWGAMLTLLSIEDPALRERLFERIAAVSGSGVTTFNPDLRAALRTARAPDREALGRLAELSAYFGKSGSNSFVVAPERSATGAPIIANDPHLGFLIPNVWLIAGVRSPSYQAVGMMLAGTPVLGFGRNERLAWGGTNLRATISQLVDVSALPPDAFETTTHEVGVRFWLDRETTSRNTAYGPVLSELEPLPTAEDAPFAIRWIGHQVSDEFTALLGAMRADNVAEFRTAMEDFAVPPQTFLAGDANGDIAGVIATKVPVREPGDGLRLLTSPAQSDREWARFYDAGDLPAVVNPPEGFLASTNNRPSTRDDRPYAGFFSQDERIRRLTGLLAEDRAISVADAAAIQLDVTSLLSQELVTALRPALEAHAAEAEEDEAAAVAALLAWDGRYDIASRGAPLFEAMIAKLAPAVYARLGRPEEHEAYDSLNLTRTFLAEDFNQLPPGDAAAVLAPAIERMAALHGEGVRWGDVHTLRIQHLFGRVPLIGDRYLLETIPIAGSRETLMKSSHALTDEPHTAFFGAQSRHISDLSDPDANFFVLLGGQDGWINSENFSDQTPLWREGRTIRVPLSPAGVRASFGTAMRLEPASR